MTYSLYIFKWTSLLYFLLALPFIMQILCFQLFWEQLFTISLAFAFKGFRLLKMLNQNFLKQIHSTPLFYITCTFSENFCVFIQENIAQAWASSEKILESKCSSFKSLSGSMLAFFKKKNMLYLKLCKPGLNQPSSGKLATTLWLENKTQDPISIGFYYCRKKGLQKTLIKDCPPRQKSL